MYKFPASFVCLRLGEIPRDRAIHRYTHSSITYIAFTYLLCIIGNSVTSLSSHPTVTARREPYILIFRIQYYGNIVAPSLPFTISYTLSSYQPRQYRCRPISVYITRNAALHRVTRRHHRTRTLVRYPIPSSLRMALSTFYSGTLIDLSHLAKTGHVIADDQA